VDLPLYSVVMDMDDAGSALTRHAPELGVLRG